MQNTPLGPVEDGFEEREITAPLDVHSLQEGWARHKGNAPGTHIRLTFGAKTDLGRVRENNEDKFDSLEPEDPAILALRGRFYAVADGMGGHAAGQIASELALKTVIRRYYANTTDDAETALTAAIKYANALVRDTAATIPDRAGMGTTLTAAIVREGELLVAQVGDSRLYLLRDGAIRQVTQDHSWVAEQVRMGAMDAQTALHSPFRNVITRSLGAAADVEVDLFREPLCPGDRVLLCSDGLSGQLSDEEILAVARDPSPSVACMELVEAANGSGGRDNITVMILRVDAVENGDTDVMEPSAEEEARVDAPEPPATPAPEAPRRFRLFGRK